MMKKTSGFHASCAVCALMVLCLSATLSYGALTADPTTATFTSPQQTVMIKLMKDAAPIPAKDIRGWRFLASGHDYKHMLNVEKMDGALRIGLSKTVDTGSYDLNIETTAGSGIVHILITPNDASGIVEKTVPLTGLKRTGENPTTKALPQVCRNFILNKYPYGMKTHEHIPNTLSGHTISGHTVSGHTVSGKWRSVHDER